MQKSFILPAILALFCLHVEASAIAPLAEITHPRAMLAAHGRLYIQEGATIYIYALDSLKLERKFGREGNGPREFKLSPFGQPMFISALPGGILINSSGKISFYSPEGDYIRERKTPQNQVLIPVGSRYVAIGSFIHQGKEFRLGMRLFDRELTPVKTLHVSEITINNYRDLEIPLSAFLYSPVWKNRIYIASGISDFRIDVWNSRGESLYRIERTTPGVTIPDEFKQWVHSWFKTNHKLKGFYDHIRPTLSFKPCFPAIRDLRVTDKGLFVITYKHKGNKWQCIHLTLKGKELSRFSVPLARYVPFTYDPLLLSVSGHNCYSIVEDEDNEVWELHATKIP